MEGLDTKVVSINITLKKIIVCFLLFTFLFQGSSFTDGKKRYEIKTVVIDAGHGGHDTGCLGNSAKEKEIALDISLKLGRLIQENYPEVRVIYTRKSDVFIELHERADIANRNKADLFICIHANSGGSAYGTETFVLGLHRAEENLAVSKRENSAILLEKDYKTQYEGFDPNSPEANIIFRLHQNTYLQQSLLFAAKVQDQLNDFAGRLNRGVKQAGLLVLARTTMPGVLIETGFLTNHEEEKYLLSSKGQNQVSTAIYRAFKEYKIDMEETPEGEISKPQVKTMVVPPVKSGDNDSMPRPIEKNQEKRTVREADKKENVEATNLMDPLPDPKQKKKEPALNNPDQETNYQQVKPTKDTVQKKTEKVATPVKEPEPVKKEPALEPAAENGKKSEKPETEVVKKGEPASPAPEGQGDVFFTIQLGAVSNPGAKERDRYREVADLRERVGEDGMTRFTTGSYISIDKAISVQNTMRGKGFKDAFVTAYSKNKRITIKEAESLLRRK